MMLRDRAKMQSDQSVRRAFLPSLRSLCVTLDSLCISLVLLLDPSLSDGVAAESSAVTLLRSRSEDDVKDDGQTDADGRKKGR